MVAGKNGRAVSGFNTSSAPTVGAGATGEAGETESKDGRQVPGNPPGNLGSWTYDGGSMITIDEREELYAMARRLNELIGKIEATVKNCHTCEHFRCGFCEEYKYDVPAEFAATHGQCEKWAYCDIPF